MIMKFDANKFALSAAITMGGVYVICAALVAVSPDIALRLTGWVFHIVDLDKVVGATNITLAGFIAGLAEILIWSYVIAFAFSYLYNRLTEMVR